MKSDDLRLPTTFGSEPVFESAVTRSTVTSGEPYNNLNATPQVQYIRLRVSESTTPEHDGRVISISERVFRRRLLDTSAWELNQRKPDTERSI